MINLEPLFVIVGVFTVWRWGMMLISHLLGRKQARITLSWFGLLFVAGLLALIIEQKRKRKE